MSRGFPGKHKRKGDRKRDKDDDRWWIVEEWERGRRKRGDFFGKYIGWSWKEGEIRRKNKRQF